MSNENKGLTLISGVTPGQFIEAIFHENLSGAFPVFTKTPKAERGVAQVKGTADAFIEQVLSGKSDAPWHYCVSYAARDEGVARRRKQDLRAVAVVVLDDVGTKVKPRYVELMPKPSFELETSEGNFQWGYILENADSDLGKFEALMRALSERGMTDPASIDAAHVFRLPGSTRSDGDFRARLTHWAPATKFTVDGLAQSAGVDLLTEDLEFHHQAPSELARERRDDQLYNWMVDRGMVYGLKSAGYVLIECPWSSNHSTGGMTADYLPLGLSAKNGDRHFKCHHAGCVNKHTPDFTRWADELGAPIDHYSPPESAEELEFRSTLQADIKRSTQEQATQQADSAAQSVSMPVQTMSELRHHAINQPPPETVLGPFQTGTWGILAALPGVGKSMFVSAITRAVSLGLGLGDYLPPERLHSVGIVDAEMSEREIHERMPLDTPDTVHWITTDLLERSDHEPFSLGNHKHQKALIDRCEQLNLTIIFIDNVEYTLEPAPGKDVWHPETWRQVIPLIRWAKRTNRVLVFIDHLNSQGGVQGSLAKQRGASFILRLEADYEEHATMCFRSEFIKIRYIVSNNLKAVRKWWLDDSGEWNCERELSKHGQVAQLLKEGVPQKDIAVEVGLSKGQVSKLARKFKADSETGKALVKSEKEHWLNNQ